MATSCFFVPEDSPSEVDSVIVCMTDGKVTVNLNDARPNSEQLARIQEITGPIDLVTLQASGASEYPITYAYPDKEMRSHCIKKRRDKLDHCQKVLDILEPRRVLFFAGPPVFLDKALASFNERHPASVFPDQLDIVRHMAKQRPDIAERTLFLLPGEECHDRYLWTKTDMSAERLYPYTHKSDYIESYRNRRKDICTPDWGQPIPVDTLLQYFEYMANLSPYMSAKIGTEVTFTIKSETDEQTFAVDFVSRMVRTGASSRASMAITVPAAALQAVIEGDATWDDVLLSARVVFDESEQYIAHFKTLLRYMDPETCAALEQYEKQFSVPTEDVPLMQVTLDGQTYYIQRYCPHAGNDLKRAGRVNDDGTITCLAHRLCFDIKTGKCLNAKNYRLTVVPEDTTQSVYKAKSSQLESQREPSLSASK